MLLASVMMLRTGAYTTCLMRSRYWKADSAEVAAVVAVVEEVESQRARSHSTRSEQLQRSQLP